MADVCALFTPYGARTGVRSSKLPDLSFEQCATMQTTKALVMSDRVRPFEGRPEALLRTMKSAVVECYTCQCLHVAHPWHDERW